MLSSSPSVSCNRQSSAIIRMLLMLLAYAHVACTFVLIAGSNGQNLPDNSNYYQPGGKWTYAYDTKVYFDEVRQPVEAKDTTSLGFSLSADVSVTSIWSSQLPTAEGTLLAVKLHAASLHTGYDRVPSALDKVHGAQILVQWQGGRIARVWTRSHDDLYVKNLLKGIASLLQFQLAESEEVDVSGNCHTRYKNVDGTKYIKTKESCVSSDLLLMHNPKPLLNTLVKSRASTEYHLAPGYFQAVTSEESHSAVLAANGEVGAEVLVKQSLRFTGAESKGELKGSFGDVIAKLIQQENFVDDTLPASYKKDSAGKLRFGDTVSKERKQFAKFGTIGSARAFLRCVESARTSTKEEILKVLTAKSNEAISLQLLDILGYVQTSASHEAVTKLVHFDSVDHVDGAERYLWALSFSSQPNVIIMEDLLHKFKNTQNIPEKVKETLIATLASMAKNLHALHTGYDGKIYRDILDTIVNYLDASSKQVDRLMYLRALLNLESERTLPLLVNLTRNSKTTSKEVVLAWRAIKEISTHKGISEDTLEVILAQAERTFLQLSQKEDSSARTVALDILLESSMKRTTVRQTQILPLIVNYLKMNESDKEVKQYVLQRLEMWQEVDAEFASRVHNIITADAQLNNYHSLAPRGLSVAMQRRIYTGCSSNGSLSTVQEVQQGLVKRGVVSVRMEGTSDTLNLFDLGIFTGGLGAFLSSGDDSISSKDDTVATAGMELAVLGTHLRPFVFFNGQGELMGHVWSGTGSDRTTAFQALVMLHFHEQVLRLGNGFIVEIDVKGGASFDLAGQISISLWYRNADSKVEKSGAIFTTGALRLCSPWWHNSIEFSHALEPRLELAATVDFGVSSAINLCMRLQQPAVQTVHTVQKIERSPMSTGNTDRSVKNSGSKQPQKRYRVHRRSHIPGRTYMLNQKNSEMCNAINN